MADPVALAPWDRTATTSWASSIAAVAVAMTAAVVIDMLGCCAAPIPVAVEADRLTMATEGELEDPDPDASTTLGLIEDAAP